MNISKKTLKEIYVKWNTLFDETPEDFESEESRKAKTLEERAAESAEYFYYLYKELKKEEKK